MKHNYSNADIRRATVYAGLDVHAADIRLILDALPEPATDDCQEAPFIPVVDAQKGDRVRIDTWQDAHEVTVTEVDPATIYWEHGHTPKKYVTSVRLLDRPVTANQHPYPAHIVEALADAAFPHDLDSIERANHALSALWDASQIDDVETMKTLPNDAVVRSDIGGEPSTPYNFIHAPYEEDYPAHVIWWGEQQ